MTGMTAPSGETALDREQFTYSIVIPVFNSEELVGTTVDQVVAVFTEHGLKHEVILVNDGSHDDSWEKIAEKARTVPNVVALDMLRNYGQHQANLAGLRETTGDYVITMDDDLQNPPDQALVLIDEAMTGKDVVFGKFERKKAAGYRRIGSRMISMLNRRIFGQPSWLTVSNFRILRRDVVDRICASRTAHPYITGQALIYSRKPGHVPVRHEPRPVGKSNYSLIRILRLVLTILFSYSSYPLRARRGGRVRDLGAEPPARRVLPHQRALRAHRGRGLDHPGGPARRLQRVHDRDAVHARRVRRPHPQRGQQPGELSRHHQGAGLTRHLLVVGAQRCGTTYLHDLLAAHPEIAMARPARPEPKVFLSDDLVGRGRNWYLDTFFAHATDERLLGEKSTSYLEYAEAATRAAAMLGDPLIIVQLRDPVQRAISNWAFSSDSGLETRTVAEALSANLEGTLPWDPDQTSVSPFAYLERGRYADYLGPWTAHFGDDVKIVFLEELRSERGGGRGSLREPGRRPERPAPGTRGAGQREPGQRRPGPRPAGPAA